MGLLLQEIWSALDEQTWIMQQMWATHTAVESELWLLRRSAEYTFNCIFWVPYDEWRRCVGALIRLQGSYLVTLCISCLEGNSRNFTYYLYVFAISKYVQGVLNYPP